MFTGHSITRFLFASKIHQNVLHQDSARCLFITKFLCYEVCKCIGTFILCSLVSWAKCWVLPKSHFIKQKNRKQKCNTSWAFPHTAERSCKAGADVFLKQCDPQQEQLVHEAGVVGCTKSAGEGYNHPCDGPHHFIALWQYCLSTEVSKWSIFLVLWGVWSAALAVWEGNHSWRHGMRYWSIPLSMGRPRFGLTLCFQVHTSPSVIPSSVLSLPCGSHKEIRTWGGAMRTTEKLLCFGYILAYPQALCKLSLPLLEI